MGPGQERVACGKPEEEGKCSFFQTRKSPSGGTGETLVAGSQIEPPGESSSVGPTDGGRDHSVEKLGV